MSNDDPEEVASTTATPHVGAMKQPQSVCFTYYYLEIICKPHLK